MNIKYFKIIFNFIYYIICFYSKLRTFVPPRDMAQWQDTSVLGRPFYFSSTFY